MQVSTQKHDKKVKYLYDTLLHYRRVILQGVKIKKAYLYYCAFKRAKRGLLSICLTWFLCQDKLTEQIKINLQSRSRATAASWNPVGQAGWLTLQTRDWPQSSCVKACLRIEVALQRRSPFGSVSLVCSASRSCRPPRYHCNSGAGLLLWLSQVTSWVWKKGIFFERIVLNTFK